MNKKPKKKESEVATQELVRHENCFQHFCSMLASCFFFVELRYASAFDKLLMFIGLFSAVILAMGVPLILELLGDMLSYFIAYDLNMIFLQNQPKRRQLDSLVLLGMRWMGHLNEDKNITVEHLFLKTRYFAMCVSLLGTLQWIFAALCIFTLNQSAQKFALRIRVQYVKAILSNDLAWFDEQNARELAASTINLINDIHAGLSEKLGLLVFSACSVLFCFIMALIHDWKLALISMTAFPLFLTVLFVGRIIMKRLERNEFASYKLANDAAKDSIVNIRHVTLYRGRDAETEIFHKCLNMCQGPIVYVGAFHGLFLGVLWVCIYCNYASSFYYGSLITFGLYEDGQKADRPVSKPSSLIVTFFCIQIGMLYLSHIPAMWKTVMKAKRSATKVYAVIDNVSSIYSEKTFDAPRQIDEQDEGVVTFEDVYFSYPSNPTEPVLKGVSFIVERNETVAFVGPCGRAGITTIMRLIHRLYDPQQGQVTIAGCPLQSASLLWVRQRVAYVMQDSVLFGTNFSDAIRGNQAATQKELMDVAEITGCHDYITQTTTQYSSSLSPNIPEKILQRMAIARALLQGPSILILDRATTSLTAKEESKLHDHINKMGTHHTLIIVTNRVESIAKADRVIHVVEGEVVENGTFVELMQSRGELYRVYQRSAVTMPRKRGNWPDSLDEYEPVPSPALVTARDLSKHHRRQHSLNELNIQTAAVTVCRFPPLPGGVENQQIDYAGFIEGDQQLYTWLTVLKLNSPEWLYLTTACVAAAIAGLCLPAYAVLFGDCLFVLSRRSEDYTHFRTDLQSYTLLFMCAAFTTGIAKVVQWYMISVAGAIMTKRLRKQVFKAMLEQELAWFDEEANTVDALLTLIRVDARNAREATGPLLTSLAQAASTLFTCAYLTLHYNFKLAFVLVILATPHMLSMLYYNMILTRVMFSEGISLQKAKAIMMEAITNIRSVITLGMQSTFLRQYGIEMVKIHSRMRRDFVKRSILFGMSLAIPCYTYALCVVFAGHLMQREQLTPASAFKISEIVVLGTIMVGQLISFSPKTVQARISASRILKIVQREPLDNIKTITEYKEHWKCDGELKFRRVGFQHRTQMGLPVLNNFNLFLRSGYSVTLVGTLGGGKSVPVQLLVRFYNPTAGVIILDNRDTAFIHIEMVRKQIGLADGHPIFFRRTIAENIAYGDVTRRMKMDEVTSIAKEAYIHNYINTLPDGYHTIVDKEKLEMTYSQKFRLSLARALYRDPQILLIENLNVAESEEAEMLIEAAITRALQGRTCIMVADSVKAAGIQCTNYICVLSEGQVVEEGTHSDLINSRGIYYKLCCRAEMLHRRTDPDLIFTYILDDATRRAMEDYDYDYDYDYDDNP